MGELLSERYEILGILGRGGMGVVYRAHDRELDEIVAVKILRSDYAGSTGALRRLQAEIKLARKVRDPRVCAIHEFGREGHIAYIVMEHVPGQDLGQLLRRRGALRPQDACPLAIQLCSALEAIHAAGIVHRDLKPENIMIDTRRVVRLMDFGIAKGIGVAAASPATATGHVIGTPAYMSPEQARGERVDFRSDLYALGVIVCELVTGAAPSREGIAAQTEDVRTAGPPAWSADDARRLPASMRSVIARALSENPDDRFQTPGEMRAALERVCAEAPTDVGLGAIADAGPLTVSSPDQRDLATSVFGTGSSVSAGGSARPRPVRRANRLIWLVPPALALSGVFFLWRAGERRAASPAPTAPGLLMSPLAGSLDRQETEKVAAPDAGTRAEGPSRHAPLASAPRLRAPSRAEHGPSSRSRDRSASDSGARPGRLAFLVVPWAQVSLDGRPIGTTPLRPVSISPGRHAVVLSHPAYEPLHRSVVVLAGETTTLEVDLSDVAFPLARK